MMNREVKRKAVAELNSRGGWKGQPKYYQKDIIEGLPQNSCKAFMVFKDGSVVWGLCLPKYKGHEWCSLSSKSGGYDRKTRTQNVVYSFGDLKEQPIGYILYKEFKKET